jgi:hypothetical protein
MVQQENKLITFVKGISGTGKSSRVLQLLMFYQDVMGYEPVSIKNHHQEKGKELHAGLLIEQEKTLFIGKFYERDGVKRFQGHDSVTGAFNGSDDFSNFLTEKGKDYKIIVEGSGTTLSYRFRPKFLFESGFDKMFFQYYNYKMDEQGKKEYKKRILLRSGKDIEKDSMWRKGFSFQKEYEKSLIESEEVATPSIIHSYDDHTPHISDFGQKYLFLNDKDEDVIDAFIEYTNIIEYTKINVYKP